MEQYSIREVAAWAGGLYEGPDLPIAGASIDSRKIGPGELFIPLRGAHHDAHEFLGEAFASGAAAALVDRPALAAEHADLGHRVITVKDTSEALQAIAAGYRRSLDLTVVGITGSNGKTTTKEMLKLLLGSRAVASPRSFNNAIGVPLTLLRAQKAHSICVVEMGTNAPGEIADLAAIAKPDVGVVLNVGESHLQGLGDLEGVSREKFALVEALSPDGCAVLNWDDPHTRAMIDRAPGYALSFGTWPEADVYGGDVRTRGRSFELQALRAQARLARRARRAQRPQRAGGADRRDVARRGSGHRLRAPAGVSRGADAHGGRGRRPGAADQRRLQRQPPFGRGGDTSICSARTAGTASTTWSAPSAAP